MAVEFCFNMLKRLRLDQAVFWKRKCVASVKKIAPTAIKQASIPSISDGRIDAVAVISMEGEVLILMA